MLALGSVKTIVTENVKNGRIQFDMHGFLAGVILADLNLAGELLTSSGHMLLWGNRLLTPVSVVYFCLLLWVRLTSSVSFPPWPSVVGGQPLHSSYVT